MLHLYTDNDSPNGYKVLIALEEAALHHPHLRYEIHPIHLGRGENRTPQFLALNPHGRVPVLHDDNHAATVFESAAILLYLAQQFPALIPQSTAANASALQWMIYHAASVGPTIGQYFNFAVSEKGKNTEATARFTRLMNDAFTVMTIIWHKRITLFPGNSVLPILLILAGFIRCTNTNCRLMSIRIFSAGLSRSRCVLRYSRR